MEIFCQVFYIFNSIVSANFYISIYDILLANI